MNIEHISVSRKSVWDECQERYRFQYHLKTPIPGPEKPYFAYGKIIHKIAEEYVNRGNPNGFNEVVDDVLFGNVELEEGKVAPDLEKEYANKLGGHLKNLKKFVLRIGIDHPGHVEYKFKYDLLPPNQFNVTGFIDRIVVKGDQYFILDYKTTKKGPWRKNKHNVIYDIQLRLYARVVQKEFGVAANNIHCCLYYLEGDEVIGATFNQKSLEDAEQELLDAYIQIHETPPEKAIGNVGNHCTRCDFNKMCRFYSLM